MLFILSNLHGWINPQCSPLNKSLDSFYEGLILSVPFMYFFPRCISSNGVPKLYTHQHHRTQASVKTQLITFHQIAKPLNAHKSGERK